MKILVVDDDKEIIEIVKTTLTTDPSYEIGIAYDGEEALEQLKRNLSYDLLILDILIPKLSGIEVCQFLVQNEKLKKIPVLLISDLPIYSDVFRESCEKFDELSVVKGLLEKPFSINDLLIKVKTTVGYR